MTVAYPGENDSQLFEQIATDFYISALNDHIMELKIREREPTTIESAFKHAVRLEAYESALCVSSCERYKARNEASTDETYVCNVTVLEQSSSSEWDSPTETARDQELEEICARMEEMRREIDRLRQLQSLRETSLETVSHVHTVRQEQSLASLGPNANCAEHVTNRGTNHRRSRNSAVATTETEQDANRTYSENDLARFADASELLISSIRQQDYLEHVVCYSSSDSSLIQIEAEEMHVITIDDRITKDTDGEYGLCNDSILCGTDSKHRCDSDKDRDKEFGDLNVRFKTVDGVIDDVCQAVAAAAMFADEQFGASRHDVIFPPKTCLHELPLLNESQAIPGKGDVSRQIVEAAAAATFAGVQCGLSRRDEQGASQRVEANCLPESKCSEPKSDVADGDNGLSYNDKKSDLQGVTASLSDAAVHQEGLENTQQRNCGVSSDVVKVYYDISGSDAASESGCSKRTGGTLETARDEVGTSCQAEAAAATFAVSKAGASRHEETLRSGIDCYSLKSPVLPKHPACAEGDDDENVAQKATAPAEMSYSQLIGPNEHDDKLPLTGVLLSACELHCADVKGSDFVHEGTEEEELKCAEMQYTCETAAAEKPENSAVEMNVKAFCRSLSALSLSSTPSVLEYEGAHPNQSTVQQPFDPGGEPLMPLKHAGETADSFTHNSKLEASWPTTEMKQHKYQVTFTWSPTILLLAYANLGGSLPGGRSKGRPTSPDPGGGACLRSRLSDVITANITIMMICSFGLILYVFVQCICCAIKFAGTRMARAGGRVPGLGLSRSSILLSCRE